MLLPLSDPSVTLENGGGKALNLGVMLRASLPVPDGFVILTDAYRAFVAHNQLDLTRSPEQIRADFAAGEVPEELAAAITRAAAGMGPVAVRSSATAEDLPDASFAGQQDTELGVEAAGLLDAVRRCWGSLWTDRAVAYRSHQGIPADRVALAVVVQRMAPATAAGVLFTADPVSGRRDRMVLNATWGLGEALVSGRVNPDTYVADRDTGRVLRRTLGEKAVMTTNTGTVDVPAEDRARASLTDAHVVSLVTLGRSLEALFGRPQDVEWAIVGDDAVLLQSRAVTTAYLTGDDAWAPTTRAEPWPFDFWTQQDMGERWPEPLTPLTWSVCEPMNQDILDKMLGGLKAPYAGRIQWSKRAFGRVYMNEGAMLHAYIHGLGMPISMLRSACTHPGSVPPDADRWRMGKVFAHLPYFWEVATSWEKKVDVFEAAFPTIDEWVDSFMAEDLAGRSDADCLDQALGLWMGRLTHYVGFHTAATSLSMSSYDELDGLVKKHGLDSAQELVGGISGVTAAEMGPELAAIAAGIQALGMGELALERPAEALAALRTDPRAAEVRGRLDTFLRRHGHRGSIEAELLHPRWSEAPELVIVQLAPYLRGAPAPSGEAAAARREAATTALQGRLGWFGRQSLQRALTRAHRFTRMRDNGQSYIVKLLMPVRRLLAELGRRFAARGWLAREDDVFFLVVEELRAAIGGDATGVQARADARREAWRHWFTHDAPDALDAAGEPVETPISEEPGLLTGVAASRGTVTGVARVVLSPADAGRLLPGEILVTRATDPGWTPVFSVIGGAVLEIGGLLSHGAIVAREYGLPAVVNVPQATRRIADGDRVTVDGTTGRVQVLGGESRL